MTNLEVALGNTRNAAWLRDQTGPNTYRARLPTALPPRIRRGAAGLRVSDWSAEALELAPGDHHRIELDLPQVPGERLPELLAPFSRLQHLVLRRLDWRSPLRLPSGLTRLELVRAPASVLDHIDDVPELVLTDMEIEGDALFLDGARRVLGLHGCRPLGRLPAKWPDGLGSLSLVHSDGFLGVQASDSPLEELDIQTNAPPAALTMLPDLAHGCRAISLSAAKMSSRQLLGALGASTPSALRLRGMPLDEAVLAALVTLTPGLRTLVLADAGLADDVIAGLRAGDQIEHLDLSGNPITERALIGLSTHTLRTLDLSDTRAGRALCHGTWDQLQALSLQAARDVCFEATQCPRLVHLDLAWSDAESLGDLPVGAPALQGLLLERAPLSDAQGLGLARWLGGSRVARLDLRRMSYWQRATYAAIAEKAAPHLVDFEAGDHSCATGVIDGLRAANCPALVRLDVGDVDTTHPDVVSVLDRARCPLLNDLRIAAAEPRTIDALAAWLADRPVSALSVVISDETEAEGIRRALRAAGAGAPEPLLDVEY